MSSIFRPSPIEVYRGVRDSRVVQIALLIGIVLILLPFAINARNSRHASQPVPVATSTLPPGPTPQLPAAIQQPTQPGLLQLDDFQVVIPKGWQRRSDWEDVGPGTKLFLLGPKVADVALVIGIDVYPLREGTTLEQFTTQYSARWDEASISNKPARLCEQPARLLGLTENSLDKLYLITVCKNRGYAVGMIGPTGQSAQCTPLFRQLVDSFQLYE
ncbi:MAG: hypothetical protein ACYC63_01055 [Armatimonadota bacterium]